MGISFNADEIFEMAEQIERNGVKFYSEAAKNVSDKETKQMLLEFATMEEGHVKTFAEMRKELGPQEKAQIVFDPDNQAAAYLQVMADSRGWEGKATPTDELTGDESIEQILQSAIAAEKNSVVFYVGLKEMVSARAGKDKVEAIIKEELSHVATLTQKLMDLK
jgi:rubrerythrin